MFKNKFILLLLIFSIGLGIYRIIPFFEVNIGFGYDPGLYRFMFMDYINNLPNIDFKSLSNYTRGGLALLLGPLINILHIIGFNVDNLLSFGLGFFSIITSIFIYINLKKYSKITGIIGIILFMISIIQYKSFAMNYYKQIIGVIFFLAIFYLFEKRKYLLSFPIIISVFTIHRPSGLFFLLVFIFYKIFDFYKYKKEKQILEKNIKKKGYKEKLKNLSFNFKDLVIVFIAGIIAFLMYLPLFKELILSVLKPLTTTIASSGPSGSFFLIGDFLKYDFVFILLSLLGLYYKIKNKDYDYIFWGYIVGALWIILKLFFYNRFLIFFDIFIILLVSYSLGIIYKENKKIFYILFIGIFILQSFFYISFVNSNNKPEISQIELANIEKINKIIPQNSYIIVNSRSRSPWLAGYTLRKIIAPGLFEYDKLKLEGWKKWWFGDGKTKCDLLEKYYGYIKEPIYFWKTKFRLGNKWYDENMKNGYCFKKMNFKGKTFSLYKVDLRK